MTLQGIQKSLEAIPPIAQTIATLGFSIVVALVLLVKDVVREFGLVETPSSKEHMMMVTNQQAILHLLGSQTDLMKSNVAINRATCIILAGQEKDAIRACSEVNSRAH